MTQPTDTADLADLFARHVVQTRFESLPAAAVQAARDSTLDTLGCMVGATGFVPSLRHVAELLLDAGGKPESTIIGFGGRAPSYLAAFANGAMAHCLDYDDHLPEGHHPSSAPVPALFALAEKLGGVSGRQFVTALAVGQDVFARLRKNVQWRQDWHLTPVLGVYAATAACAKLLGLSREQTVNALGIASCQSAGTMELGYGVGSDLRGMYAAFSAKGAVFSALLAQRGITGVQTAFEGKAGVMPVYFGGRWDREAALAGLGEDYQGAPIIYKPWPSCGASHVYIDAVLKLLAEHRLTGDDLQAITVHVGNFAQRLCEPLDARRHPATVLDSKFSIPYTVALAVARGRVSLGDFTEAALKDPEVLRIADKIDFATDDAYDWKSHLPGGKVTLRTRDGRTFALEVLSENVRGSSNAPLGWADLVDKFDDCVRHAARPLSADAARKVCADVHGIVDCADMSTIIRQLA
ncbi:MAG: MmgE/PrpD family protein [Rubrivivax sp.]